MVCILFFAVLVVLVTEGPWSAAKRGGGHQLVGAATRAPGASLKYSSLVLNLFMTLGFNFGLKYLYDQNENLTIFICIL